MPRPVISPPADAPPGLASGELTDDALLGGRLHLLQPARGHRAGHDALLLAATVPAQSCRAVDLGAGIGTAGLAVAARLPQARLTLVEIDLTVAALARRNADRQQPDMAGRVCVVEADIASLGRPGGLEHPAPRAADCVLMNPPFNDPARHRTSPLDAKARAHSVPDAAALDWIKAAERLLEPAGRLRLIHRPEALAVLLALLQGRFGAVSILPVHPMPAAPAIRVLIGAIKGRRTPLRLLPGLVLADAQGRPTPEADRLLREGGALALE